MQQRLLQRFQKHELLFAVAGGALGFGAEVVALADNLFLREAATLEPNPAFSTCGGDELHWQGDWWAVRDSNHRFESVPFSSLKNQ